MSGRVETEHGRRILRHERGSPGTEVSRSLTHRATSRLYLTVFLPFDRKEIPMIKMKLSTELIKHASPGKRCYFCELNDEPEDTIDPVVFVVRFHLRINTVYLDFKAKSPIRRFCATCLDVILSDWHQIRREKANTAELARRFHPVQFLATVDDIVPPATSNRCRRCAEHWPNSRAASIGWTWPQRERF